MRLASASQAVDWRSAPGSGEAATWAGAVVVLVLLRCLQRPRPSPGTLAHDQAPQLLHLHPCPRLKILVQELRRQPRLQERLPQVQELRGPGPRCRLGPLAEARRRGRRRLSWGRSPSERPQSPTSSLGSCGFERERINLLHEGINAECVKGGRESTFFEDEVFGVSIILNLSSLVLLVLVVVSSLQQAEAELLPLSNVCVIRPRSGLQSPYA
mmetsp:Transcript_20482/g.51761  ORF Transcript_20482/g.51761 Transcript_20482/m.51761 type:complete len:213 (+) Transcript_20482:469-1107(+)